MTDQQKVLDRLDQNMDAATRRLFELLRIKSISTDPAYSSDCVKAAEWLADDLASIGFESRVAKTTGHPMVVASQKNSPGKPHVLFYGHYDVQPVDPIEEWNNPPFEPVVVEGSSKQIMGRGSADDKGQLMTFVEACRAWKAENGDLPINVTILFEGEEESGSPSLVPFLEAHHEELNADFALVCDTNMWDQETPAIAVALRGLLTEELTITAADRDLHSGYYGSAAANPIHELSRIIAMLHDADGRVTLPGFYDGVHETPPEILQQWQDLGFSGEAFLKEVGLSRPAGEKAHSVLEQVWARPTCEVNGIFGGYTQEGFKTVIPSTASAKISFRLVGDQDPEAIRSSFRSFITATLPADCTVSFRSHGAGKAVTLDPESAELKKAASALEEEWGKATALIAMGGSIPIVGDFKNIFGMNSLLIGFGLADDRIHSPNEKYEYSSFYKGARSWVRILAALAH